MSAIAVGEITIIDLHDEDVHIGTTAPVDLKDGRLWLDTSTVPNVMKRWDAATQKWIKASPTEASDIGAETPSGAQDKADGAEDAAKTYADTAASSAESAAQNSLAANMGYTDYAEMVAEALLGNTILLGGYLNTELIEAASILAKHLSVENLSAISANLGSVTAGNIKGVTIEGSTFKSDFEDSTFTGEMVIGDYEITFKQRAKPNTVFTHYDTNQTVHGMEYISYYSVVDALNMAFKTIFSTERIEFKSGDYWYSVFPYFEKDLTIEPLENYNRIASKFLLDIQTPHLQHQGDPVVSIVSQGTTTNGSYVRWSNGRQVCWNPSVTLTYNHAGMLRSGWNYPASFVQNSIVAGFASHADYAPSKARGITDLVVNCSVGSSLVSASGGSGIGFVSGDTIDVQVMAIGWWK